MMLEDQKIDFERQLTEGSIQRDELVSELNRALRQIDNLNLVIETKDQEIQGWEERLPAL